MASISLMNLQLKQLSRKAANCIWTDRSMDPPASVGGAWWPCPFYSGCSHNPRNCLRQWQSLIFTELCWLIDCISFSIKYRLLNWTIFKNFSLTRQLFSAYICLHFGESTPREVMMHLLLAVSVCTVTRHVQTTILDIEYNIDWYWRKHLNMMIKGEMWS